MEKKFLGSLGGPGWKMIPYNGSMDGVNSADHGSVDVAVTDVDVEGTGFPVADEEGTGRRGIRRGSDMEGTGWRGIRRGTVGR